MDSEQAGLGIAQVLGVLRRRGLWIVLCVVVAGGVAYGLSKREIKKYTASASLSFGANALSQQIAGLSSSDSSTSSGVIAEEEGNLERVKLGSTAAKTASILGHGLTGEKVSTSVTVSARGESGIVDISATSTSPTLAATIANTYSAQFVKAQQSANRQYVTSALAVIRRELARLSPAQRFGADGLNLEDRLQTLDLLAELGYNDAEVAQEAAVPSAPSSPKVHRDALLGVILGLLLGIVVVILLERVNRRIREPEDLESIYRLPMLGVVPRSAVLADPARRDGGEQKALPHAEAEAFSLIRAHLRFFNIDRDVGTVLVASPAPGEGKTTTARHLAEAAARSGSRVLLLEVDLRHPTVAKQLDIQSGPGLAGALIGAISMDEAIHSVALKAAPGEGISGRKLDVLVAGSVLPPNPGELLESSAMGILLARAKSTYDLVVIDTPPLTAVSDAFPLLTKVDGVVIVGWIGRTRRDAAEQLQQILTGSEIPLLGVIANGAKSAGPGSYAEPDSGKVAPVDATTAGAASSAEQLAPTPNS